MTPTIEQIKEHLLKGGIVEVNPVWRYGLSNNKTWGWVGCSSDPGCCEDSFNSPEETLESILTRCGGELGDVVLVDAYVD